MLFHIIIIIIIISIIKEPDRTQAMDESSESDDVRDTLLGLAESVLDLLPADAKARYMEVKDEVLKTHKKKEKTKKTKKKNGTDKGTDATVFLDSNLERLRGMCVTLRRLCEMCPPCSDKLKARQGLIQDSNSQTDRISATSLVLTTGEDDRGWSWKELAAADSLLGTSSTLLSTSLSTCPVPIVSHMESLVATLDSRIRTLTEKLNTMSRDTTLLAEAKAELQTRLEEAEKVAREAGRDLGEERTRREELEGLVRRLSAKLEEHQRSLHGIQRLLGNP